MIEVLVGIVHLNFDVMELEAPGVPGLAVSVVLEPIHMDDKETELVIEDGVGGRLVVVNARPLGKLVVHAEAALTIKLSLLQLFGIKVTRAAVSLIPAPFKLLTELGDPVFIDHI